MRHCWDARQRTMKALAFGMGCEKLNWMVTVRPCTQPLPSGKSKNPAGNPTVPPAGGDVESKAKVPVGAIESTLLSPQDSVSPETRKSARAFRVIGHHPSTDCPFLE